MVLRHKYLPTQPSLNIITCPESQFKNFLSCQRESGNFTILYTHTHTASHFDSLSKIQGSVSTSWTLSTALQKCFHRMEDRMVWMKYRSVVTWANTWGTHTQTERHLVQNSSISNTSGWIFLSCLIHLKGNNIFVFWKMSLGPISCPAPRYRCHSCGIEFIYETKTVTVAHHKDCKQENTYTRVHRFFMFTLNTNSYLYYFHMLYDSNRYWWTFRCIHGVHLL